jgi:lambda family phage portal protein
MAAAVKPTVFDRLIGAIAPQAALRRVHARQALARAYEGASTSDGWRPKRAGASANADHAMDASQLRARARALVSNVPYISRGIEALVANTVGTGITPRSLAPNAEAIDKLWQAWVPQADADGQQDIYSLQAMAYRTMEIDGEVLIRLRTRRPGDNLAVPLQLQVLEVDWIDSAKNGSAEGGQNIIVNGIEFDTLGRKVAYWMWDQHPGDLVLPRNRRSVSRRVAADNIIHLFAPKRPGQSRGISRLAPIIARVRDLQLYEDAELARKNLETRLSVIASGDASSMTLSESESQAEVRSSGELGMLGSGSVVGVPAGLSLTVVEPKAAPGYVEYLKFNLHLVAAGMGVTYEMLTGDVRETTFSSARVGLLEFRRHAEQMQWLTMVPNLCAPIWSAFLAAAELGGALRRPNAAVDWSTPRWDYVNPQQDVNADLAEISGGLSSISEKLRRRGYKPNLVFAELKTDFERLREDGTLDLLMQLQTGQATQASKNAAANQQGSSND